jgi:hypothetical protein
MTQDTSQGSIYKVDPKNKRGELYKGFAAFVLGIGAIRGPFGF